MKILLSAFSCCPGKGSEPGVGWNWAKMLAKNHEVWVVTEQWSRSAIQAELAREHFPNLHFEFIPCGRAVGSMGRFLGLHWLEYRRWQKRAFQRARTLHAQHTFDLVQHVTLVTWRAPSYMWRLGIPFIWGPVGGGQSSPPGFGAILGPRGRAHEALRNLAQTVGKYDPQVRATMRNAAAIVCANTSTRDFLPSKYTDKSTILLETAIHPPNSNRPIVVKNHSTPLEILWVGVFEPRKALPLLLHAMQRLPSTGKYHLTVVGDGEEKGRWVSLTEKLGLNELVTFTGWIPYSRMQKIYADADVFVFSSIRDTSGNVLLEAMAFRLPVICLNWSGPGDLTTDNTAVRITPENPEQVIAEIALSLEKLAKQPDLRRTLAEAARNRLFSEYTWECKAAKIEKIYARAIAEFRNRNTP